MYLSDMQYANGWLYNGTYYPWTISPLSYSSYASCVWSSSSSYAGYYYVYRSRGVWPFAYLDSNVRIVDGYGASTKTTDGTGPYVLKLD